MNVIQVDHLSFAYDTMLVLENISFSVKQGECIGIIGPNGGGKTTLLSLLMGFLTPQKGSIQVLGKQPEEARTSLGWVPQSFGFDRRFPISVLEVVLMGLLKTKPVYGWYNKKDREKALEALDSVGMVDFHKRAFFSLSRGQAQRVLFARALVTNPEILFLDEATASIDPESQKTFYSFLNKFKGHKTILMVTHDYKSALNAVDRVLCVQRELTLLNREALCEHYALGLYHPPLLPKKEAR